MTASSEVAATTVDKTGASDAAFQAMLERANTLPRGVTYTQCPTCLQYFAMRRDATVRHHRPRDGDGLCCGGCGAPAGRIWIGFASPGRPL